MSTPHYTDGPVTIWHGDCLDVMRQLPDDSVDAVVTDPPYGLEFMGREWDSFKPAKAQIRKPSARDVERGIEAADTANSLFKRNQPDAYVAGRPFQAWCEEWAREAYRLLKPGGHLLAFGGTRTFHRLTSGIEDAGFEIRDSIAWLYGSGFPKSLDVAKAIDKLDATDERATRARTFQTWLREHLTPQEVNALTGTDMGHHLTTHPTQPAVATADLFDRLRPHLPEVPAHIEQLVTARTVESQNFKAREVVGQRTTGLGTGRGSVAYIADSDNRDVTVPHTDEAARWNGWGTALKPAFEPIVVARKPLQGTVAANVLAHGTGALNIDGSRIEGDVPSVPQPNLRGTSGHFGSSSGRIDAMSSAPAGRWPANVVLDASQAAALDQQSGDRPGFSGGGVRKRAGDGIGFDTLHADGGRSPLYGDTGGASRFFKTVDTIAPRFMYTAKAGSDERPGVDGVSHPTVKPVDLMRWLVKLVTPPGGVVLEPFAGSGTTVEAAVLEGFHCIAIEREGDYLPLILQRVRKPHAVGLDLDWDAPTPAPTPIRPAGGRTSPRSATPAPSRGFDFGDDWELDA